jgi:cell division protein ZapA (FtsZ GTPase activity inhibitor)
MATLSVEVNGRAYVVGCEDGQEAHVEALAAKAE